MARLTAQLKPIKGDARVLLQGLRRDLKALRALHRSLDAKKMVRALHVGTDGLAVAVAKRKPAKPKPTDADPPLTPELEQSKELALALLKSARRTLYSLGSIYGSLVENGDPQKAGFRSVDDFWHRHIPTDVIGIRLIQLWSRIGAYFSAGVCGLYSATCLDLLLRYGAIFKEQIPADPGDLFVYDHATIRHDGKKFRDCTEVDMKAFSKLPSQAPMEPPPFVEFRDAARAVDKKIELSWNYDKDQRLFFSVKTDEQTWPLLVLGLVAWAKDHTFGRNQPIPPGWPGAPS